MKVVKQWGMCQQWPWWNTTLLVACGISWMYSFDPPDLSLICWFYYNVSGVWHDGGVGLSRTRQWSPTNVVINKLRVSTRLFPHASSYYLLRHPIQLPHPSGLHQLIQCWDKQATQCYILKSPTLSAFCTFATLSIPPRWGGHCFVSWGERCRWYSAGGFLANIWLDTRDFLKPMSSTHSANYITM